MLDNVVVDIFNKCSHARDGMSGTLNYSVLLEVANSQGLKDYDDVLFYANEVESLLAKKRENKKGR